MLFFTRVDRLFSAVVAVQIRQPGSGLQPGLTEQVSPNRLGQRWGSFGNPSPVEPRLKCSNSPLRRAVGRRVERGSLVDECSARLSKQSRGVASALVGEQNIGEYVLGRLLIRFIM